MKSLYELTPPYPPLANFRAFSQREKVAEGRMRGSFIVILLLLIAPFAFADRDAQPPQTSEEKELADLLSIVQEETEVATKTRANSDYVPGIVTVLEGDELAALGARNAGDALGFVPGLQPSLDDRGTPSVIVRGIDFPFNAGNIQILINGIALARPDGGITTSLLLIPIEQIDRIEVIRGPGSVVYGDFAFMGLVNIITRRAGTRAALRAESPHATELGMLRIANKAKENELSYSANYSKSSSDNAAVGITAPRARDEREFGMFDISRGGFAVSAITAHRIAVPQTGLSQFHETSWAAQTSYEHQLAQALRSEASLTYLQNDIATAPSQFRGHLMKLAGDLWWTGWKHQSWHVGADYSRSTIDDAFHRNPPMPGQPPGDPVLLAHDARRNITGFTLQDQIDLNDRFSVTAGARYDAYSDLDDRVTPRLAFVWRATDHHILKAQYSEGYRPPTFFELYSPRIPNARYPFEVNRTTELNYVYRDNGQVGRATIYHVQIHDMIRPGGFVTPQDAISNGFELEWSQQFTPQLRGDFNGSHVDTKDPRTTASRNPVSARYLGNAMLLYHPLPKLLLAGRWNVVNDRVGGSGYDTIDLTASREDLFRPGLTLRGGIKNALDTHVSYLLQPPIGATVATFYPGRSLFVEMSWKR
jgi:iron complex outermembrane receptor protein